MNFTNASHRAHALRRFQALGRLPKGSMNKTETAYALVLETQKQAGQILDYRFHALKIRLADNTYYEADFVVLHADMRLAIHETKGGWTTDKGQLKIKIAAQTLPWFGFYKCSQRRKSEGGGWNIEDYSA